jgi:protein dithiol oxidoreductase (disulfide-forming)
MKKIAAFVGLLLVATVGCGGQQPPTPATPAPQASPPAASTSAPAAAAKTPAPAARTPSAESGSAIEAGEAVDTADDEPAATRANTLLAQAMTQAKPEPASTGHWAQGVNYQVLVPAQPTNVAPDKVEVVEVFWYACPHCYALEPFLENWKSKKAPYIQFVPVPVMWGPVHRAHAKLFYTLQALGKEEELHNAVMREMQVNHNMLASNDPIETEQVQMEFARRNGIKEEDFRKAYESFAVETNLQRAEQLTRRYQISGVPTFVVNGKYTADVGSAGGQSQIIDLITDLAAREQKKQ